MDKVSGNDLNESIIKNKLISNGLDIDVRVFDEIDSTNNEGKRCASTLKKPLLLLADQQTQGRGRQGHTFYSPAFTGLYMTIVVPTSLPLSTIALTTQIMAVAATRAVKKVGGPQLQIKWVNDLYLGSKKTAGILTEAVTDPGTRQTIAVVCGIGLNLTTETFPEEIRNIAGTLGSLERNLLASEITLEFLCLMDSLPETSSWLDEYRQRSLVLGRRLSFYQNGQLCVGIGKEIDDQGCLIVNLEDGTEQILSSGEVSVVPVFS